MTKSTKVLYEGLDFGEGPRWHDGRLWVSDFYQRKIRTIGIDGSVDIVLSDLDDQPSGLGWLPDGRLLFVAMTSRQLRVVQPDGTIDLHADLSSVATFHCNDMVVNANGNAYVGNFGWDISERFRDLTPASLALVTPDGTVSAVADELLFPNGSVITPDGSTLIVGETFGGQYTAFDINDDGSLTGRRIWASVEGLAPDGCCMDEDGGIWFANAMAAEVLRVVEGGEITDRVTTSQNCYACMLGGDDGKMLFAITAQSAEPEKAAGTATGKVEICRVDVPGAGLP